MKQEACAQREHTHWCPQLESSLTSTTATPEGAALESPAGSADACACKVVLQGKDALGPLATVWAARSAGCVLCMMRLTCTYPLCQLVNPVTERAQPNTHLPAGNSASSTSPASLFTRRGAYRGPPG